jgi:outer membrane lipoprotein-sorting protein
MPPSAGWCNRNPDLLTGLPFSQALSGRCHCIFYPFIVLKPETPNIPAIPGRFLTGFLLLMSLVLLSSPLAAQQKFSPVKDVAAFRTLYASKSAAISTLRCDFVQEKSISMMKNKLSSDGYFIFKKDNRLRMEYTHPYAYVFILNGDQVLIRNDQKKTSIPVNSSKLYRMISQLTIDCVTGNVLNSSDFDVSASENNTVYQLVMIPRQKMLKSVFTRIEILISKHDFTVDRILMQEASGDSTLLTFSNKKINLPAASEVFTLN